MLGYQLGLAVLQVVQLGQEELGAAGWLPAPGKSKATLEHNLNGGPCTGHDLGGIHVHQPLVRWFPIQRHILTLMASMAAVRERKPRGFKAEAWRICQMWRDAARQVLNCLSITTFA